MKVTIRRGLKCRGSTGGSSASCARDVWATVTTPAVYYVTPADGNPLPQNAGQQCCGGVRLYPAAFVAVYIAALPMGRNAALLQWNFSITFWSAVAVPLRFAFQGQRVLGVAVLGHAVDQFGAILEASVEG